MGDIAIILLTVVATIASFALGAWLYVRFKIRQLSARLAAPYVVREPARGPAQLGAELSSSLGYETLEDTPSAPKSLPVLNGVCGGCTSWNHAAGQKAMDAHPAFRAWQQWQAPHQMSQRRNPAHIECERRLHDAREELVDEAVNAKVAALERELAAIPEYLDSRDEEKKVADMQLTWSDFGLCTRHKKVVDKTHTCEQFAPVK